MSRLHSKSRARQLLASVAIASTAASIGWALGRHSLPGEQVASAANSPVLAGWVHDDSVPDSADTLSHERLPDQEAAPTF